SPTRRGAHIIQDSSAVLRFELKVRNLAARIPVPRRRRLTVREISFAVQSAGDLLTRKPLNLLIWDTCSGQPRWLYDGAPGNAPSTASARRAPTPCHLGRANNCARSAFLGAVAGRNFFLGSVFRGHFLDNRLGHRLIGRIPIGNHFPGGTVP